MEQKLSSATSISLIVVVVVVDLVVVVAVWSWSRLLYLLLLLLVLIALFNWLQLNQDYVTHLYIIYTANLLVVILMDIHWQVDPFDPFPLGHFIFPHAIWSAPCIDLLDAKQPQQRHLHTSAVLRCFCYPPPHKTTVRNADRSNQQATCPSLRSEAMFFHWRRLLWDPSFPCPLRVLLPTAT